MKKVSFNDNVEVFGVDFKDIRDISMYDLGISYRVGTCNIDMLRFNNKVLELDNLLNSCNCSLPGRNKKLCRNRYSTVYIKNLKNIDYV